MGFNVFQSEHLPIGFDKMMPALILYCSILGLTLSITLSALQETTLLLYIADGQQQQNILKIIFTVIKESGSDVTHNLLLTDIPLDTWMSIVVSYDQDSSTVSLMRDCWHKNSESIDPDVIYDININNLKVGRAPTNGYAHCTYFCNL